MTDARNVASLESIGLDRGQRPHNYLTVHEIDRLIAAAKQDRYGVRNTTLILMMFRHGLRVSEAVNMKVSDLNLDRAVVYVKRVKGSLSIEHPIEGDELRLIRKYLKQRSSDLPWLFISANNGPLSRFTVNSILRKASKIAGLAHVHPHMLRHSCGFYLVNNETNFRVIQDYLGHRNPSNTAQYTRLAPGRFEGLFSKSKH